MLHDDARDANKSHMWSSSPLSAFVFAVVVVVDVIIKFQEELFFSFVHLSFIQLGCSMLNRGANERAYLVMSRL